MKKFSFTFFVCLFSVCNSYSQEADSAYFVKFISQETGKEIPNTILSAIDYGTFRGFWRADTNGVVKFTVIPRNDDDPRDEREPNYLTVRQDTKFIAKCDGYFHANFDAQLLIKGDTVLVEMAPGYYYFFDDVEIVSYIFPILDDKYLSWAQKRKAKKALPVIDSTTIYSTKTLATYDSITNDNWFGDFTAGITLTNWEFQEYLVRNLDYPDHAHKYEIQETISFGITFIKGGYIKKIKFMNGICPVLVIEVANCLKTISRIIFNGSDDLHDPQTFLFRVKFILK